MAHDSSLMSCSLLKKWRESINMPRGAWEHSRASHSDRRRLSSHSEAMPSKGGSFRNYRPHGAIGTSFDNDIVESSSHEFESPLPPSQSVIP